MSASLVRRGLDMFKDDISEPAVKKKKKKSNNPMKLISTNKVGVKKELRKVLQKTHKTKLTVKNKKIKSALEDYQKNLPQDMTDESLRCLQAYTRTHAHPDVLDKISKHNRRKRRVEVDSDNKNEGTVFSDKDFDKFLEEYNFS